MKKVLQVLAVIVLIILPYFPFSENFFPPEAQVDNNSFGKYISICAILIIAGILLMMFQKPRQTTAGWLLFAIGFCVLIPLHLGPPRIDATLLTSSGIEKVRYGLLIITIIVFFIAGCKVINPLRTLQARIIFIVLCLTTLINLWDNYSSFQLGAEMEKWIATGKKAEDFIFQYDFQITWRTISRLSLYVTSILLAFVLMKKQEIKKWQFAVLSFFCLIGIVFCVLCLQSGFQNYYFPFMVPAIALAPAFWTGIAMLTKKNESYKTD